MPKTAEKVTNSWRIYEECLTAIQTFLAEIRIQDGEVWIGEVCIGSPGQPCLRAPLHSAALISRSVERANAVASSVTRSIRRTIETTREEIERLKAEGEVDREGLERLGARIGSLEGLLAQLTAAAAHSPIAYHPATLIRWSEILEQCLVPGNPAVPVSVVTIYVL